MVCEKLLETESVPAETSEMDSSSEWLGLGDSELSFFFQSLFFSPMLVFGGRGCAGCTVGFFLIIL